MILLIVVLLCCLTYMTHRACKIEKQLSEEIDSLRNRNYEQARTIISLRNRLKKYSI